MEFDCLDSSRHCRFPDSYDALFCHYVLVQWGIPDARG